MHGWVECVPNFSEGQNQKLISQLESVVRAVPGVVFLRSDPNPDHNRTLFTFAGPGHSVRRAAFDLIQGALSSIDLTRHIGAHPRMGAVDVIPFVPLGSTTMESASEMARDLGEDVAEKLGIPVFLYEESATSAERRSLASLRKGGFEGHLASGFPVGPPDFGPARPHPTFGSVAIGARSFIIALDLILDTNDLEIGRAVARAVRESTRGLAAVRALALPLASQGVVQVSINVLDYRVTSLTQVMERAREEARRLGTQILGSELVGLVPRASLADAVWDMLRLPTQRRERVIEDAVENSGAFTFAERLAAATATPGGGAAAARSGLHATSLIRMVIGIARNRLKKEGGKSASALEGIRDAAISLGKKFRSLESQDEEAYDRYIASSRRARKAGGSTSAPASAASGDDAAAAALRTATEVPLQLMASSKEVLDLIAQVLDVQKREGVTLVAGSDLGAAVELLRAAFRTAELNVRSNLPRISPPSASEYRKRCEALAAELEERCDGLRVEIRRRFVAD